MWKRLGWQVAQFLVFTQFSAERSRYSAACCAENSVAVGSSAEISGKPLATSFSVMGTCAATKVGQATVSNNKARRRVVMEGVSNRVARDSDIAWRDVLPLWSLSKDSK